MPTAISTPSISETVEGESTIRKAFGGQSAQSSETSSRT